MTDDCGLIPEHIKEFGRELTELARKHGVGDYKIKVSHSFCSEYAKHPEIDIQWTQGRHAANSGIQFGMEVRKYIREEHNFSNNAERAGNKQETTTNETR